jgi:hypothetical protein
MAYTLKKIPRRHFPEFQIQTTKTSGTGSDSPREFGEFFHTECGGEK